MRFRSLAQSLITSTGIAQGVKATPFLGIHLEMGIKIVTGMS
jgi:hypothetical protein